MDIAPSRTNPERTTDDSTSAPQPQRSRRRDGLIGDSVGALRVALAVVSGVAAVVTIPAFVDSYWLGLITQSLVWVIATLSVIVFARATSAVSLCQASFMGVAANASTWFAVERGLPAEAAVVLGAVLAVPVGMILVMPALRLRGLELTVLTLMVAVAVDAMVFAGGAPLRAHQLGLHLPDRVLFGVDFGQRASAFRAALVLTIVAFTLTIGLLRGRVGRTWRAIQSGQAAAAASGISLVHHKMLGVASASLLAGVAGSLLLAVQGSADSSSFGPIVSIRLVVVAMIGGIEAPIAAVGGGIANGVGLRLPAEFGLDGAWLDLALGLIVIIAILGRARHDDTPEHAIPNATQPVAGRRAGAMLIGGGSLVASSMAAPWFVADGERLTGMHVPRLFGPAPLIAAIVVVAVGAAVCRTRAPGRVDPSATLRLRPVAAVVLVTALPIGLILVRTLVGNGAFVAGGPIAPANASGAVHRAWGLLVAAIGAALVSAAVVDLLRAAVRQDSGDSARASSRGERA